MKEIFIKLQKKYLIILFILVLLTLISIPILIVVVETTINQNYIIISTIITSLFFFSAFFLSLTFADNFDRTLRPLYLKEVDVEPYTFVNYEVDNDFDTDIILETNVFSKLNILHTSNYLTGYYNKKKFLSTDLTLGSYLLVLARYETCLFFLPFFRGKYFIFKTIVPSFYQLKILKGIKGTKNKELMKLDASLFDLSPKFNIYTNDQAFTSTFINSINIEEFNNLLDEHRGKLSIAIKNDYLHFAIKRRKTTFFVNLFKSYEKNMAILEKDYLFSKRIYDMLNLEKLYN